MLLDIGQRHLHRRTVGGKQPFVARYLGHDRNGFGRGQRDIPSWSMLDLAVARGAELLPGHPAFEQPGKIISINLACQTQRSSGLAEPFRRGEAAFGIIVVGLVVARSLPGTGQRRDRSDHQTGPGLTSGRHCELSRSPGSTAFPPDCLR